VNPKAGLTFAGSLRSILRQDPDVILVGEIRDRETAEIAFHAAMTGHLVLTTLHTTNSVVTIMRLLELGVDPFVISSSVTLIMAQRLARVICNSCRELYTPSSRVLARLKWDDPRFSFTRGKGCKACHGSGFQGRVGIYELLNMTPAVRAAINERASESKIRAAAQRTGFALLLDDAREKIRNGLTTPEEILRVIQWHDQTEAICDRCGRPIHSETGKCLACDPSQLQCLGCGGEIDPNWIVCPRCSTPVSGQRTESLLSSSGDAEVRPAALRHKRATKQGPRIVQ
jgi:hypothetical protein